MMREVELGLGTQLGDSGMDKGGGAHYSVGEWSGVVMRA